MGRMNNAETEAKKAVWKWNTITDFGGGSEWFQVPDTEFENFLQKFRRECQKFKFHNHFLGQG